jgi:hypothetical protein
MTTPAIVSTETALTARQLKARQVVLAAGTLDAWQAKFEKYGTTLSSCLCPDWQIRGRRNEITACKHMEAKRLLEARQAEGQAGTLLGTAIRTGDGEGAR